MGLMNVAIGLWITSLSLRRVIRYAARGSCNNRSTDLISRTHKPRHPVFSVAKLSGDVLNVMCRRFLGDERRDSAVRDPVIAVEHFGNPVRLDADLPGR